ncbi:unnamed protein product [Staurois parvus]|uniref:Costars family protein ABRACL n=1 Tax=Staurois parvus TaxID=386267 RepID=A0ABN9BIU2_9NEOB|nr:unnamed protein product [Staurois parvus]
MNVDHEVSLLVEQIHRLGTRDKDGKRKVKIGVLFNDDQCANLFEAMVETLKAAKHNKIFPHICGVVSLRETIAETTRTLVPRGLNPR